jgi:hypothetical protein
MMILFLVLYVVVGVCIWRFIDNKTTTKYSGFDNISFFFVATLFWPVVLFGFVSYLVADCIERACGKDDDDQYPTIPLKKK